MPVKNYTFTFIKICGELFDIVQILSEVPDVE